VGLYVGYASLLATLLAFEPASTRPPDDIPNSVVSTSPTGADDTQISESEDKTDAELSEQDTVRDERLDRLEARTEALEQENTELRKKLERTSETQGALAKRVDGLMPLTGRIGGYLDTGAFWVMGNGSGIRSDIGYQYFPEYEGVVPASWVFMGDPLSTAINSRGEVADTGESRAVTFDPVNNGGHFSFAVNALNVALFAGLGRYATVEGLIDFMPRNRVVANPDEINLGDYVDVKLAYAGFVIPAQRFDLSIEVGKFNPVFGYEYRIQESPDRINVTPSLACRYTCGRAVGLKTRWKFLPRRALVFNFSLTNGSSFWEGFGFANEVDLNHFKTVAGRLSYLIPIGAGLDVGASGMYGAQDLQADDGVQQWQYGFDAHLEVVGLEVTGEFVMGNVAGVTELGSAECGAAPCLNYKTAYGLVGYRVLNWMMPFARVDWRDAVHLQGGSFVYNSNVVRFTPGFRFEVGEHVIIKLEYSVNRELGQIPQIPNDVFTSSLVARI